MKVWDPRYDLGVKGQDCETECGVISYEYTSADICDGLPSTDILDLLMVMTYHTPCSLVPYRDS